MKTISERYENKLDGKYLTVYYTEDTEKVYHDLATVLMSKYMHKAPSYKGRPATSNNNYDGTRTITVYDENGKRTFIVQDY